MKNVMRKVLMGVLALTLALSLACGALAANYPSNAFRLPTVQHRPTAEPTEEPTAEPTAEPTVEPTEEPTVEPTAEPTEEPTPVATAKPTEVPAETEMPAAEDVPKYSFERDEQGNLVLDENGDPVVTVPDGMEVPVTWQRDEDGNLILDENGDPIPKDTVPAGSEVIMTLEDKLDPDRYIDVYVSAEEGLYFGKEATLVAVLYGYDNAVYTLQWQTSVDGESWENVPGATESRYTQVVTEENYLNYWRIEVTITDVAETASENA